jgi:hypothetical protein
MRVGNDLRDLVSGLLAFDAENRLGTFGVCQVVEHPWLGNVDWERMEAKQYIVRPAS